MIDGRVMATNDPLYNAEQGMIVGTKSNHRLRPPTSGSRTTQWS
jgi:hypothetical protein